MAQLFFSEPFIRELKKRFSEKEGNTILDLLETLKDNPKKGKELGNVGGVVIKELKYKKFRFYFITDGHKVKLLKAEELKDLIIRVVRISEKKDQSKTIEEIKHILRNLGEVGF
jgi:hypothetical protein